MLEEIAGHWEGDGAAGEDTAFRGTLELEPIAGGRGLSMSFRAVGADGGVLCRHRGILTGERLAFLDDTVGELKILDRREGYVFVSGEPGDEESYRLEVSIAVPTKGEIDLTIKSGLPGEPFTRRIQAHLTRTP
jgi:hypothetical protein